jgi:N utilization substance protein B
MQVLYQVDIQGGNLDYILDHYIELGQFHPETKDWATDLVTAAWEHVEASDAKIQEYSIGWDFNRINPVDKALLRLAFYELIVAKTHPSIIIDEVLELAKKYSTDDSPKFLNGILGKYVDKECSQGSLKK